MYVGRPSVLYFDGKEERDTVAYHKHASSLAEGTQKMIPEGTGLFSPGNFKTFVAEDFDQLVRRLTEQVDAELAVFLNKHPGYSPDHFSFRIVYQKVEGNCFWPRLSTDGGVFPVGG